MVTGSMRGIASCCFSNAVDENMDHGPEAANVPLTGKGLQRLRRLQKPMQEEEML
jgi:hypothetical protein